MPFQCNPNAAKAWFFGKQGLPPDRRTEKGAPSLDEEQVRAWKLLYNDPSTIGREKYQWAAEYEEVSKIRRAVSMWYEGYPEKAGADGRLRCYYKQAHVKSGRMSVQRIQLQAIPKADKALAVPGVPQVRWLLRAREGCALWNIDLQQAELRVAAKYSGCAKVMRMLGEGIDFHGETTKNVLGYSEDDPLWKEKRDIAKRLNFGAIFQIGAEKFQSTVSKLAGIHLPIEECETYVRNWRSEYPEFQRAYYKCMRLFEHRGYVHLMPKTEFEERSYRGPRDYPNTGWNRMVQGSLALFLKLWLIETEKRWPGYMVLTVHDSIVLEAPLDEGDELAQEISDFAADYATGLFRTEMKCDWDQYKTYVQDDQEEWVAA
jgi:DNA polymerase I-like protein with 3'-5' exonuclease and polymerase domains